MPPTDRTFEVRPYGEIRAGGRCRDDYARIITRDYTGRGGGERTATLQRAAMESLIVANAAVERKTGRPIVFTGTHRTCAAQRALHASDPNRFADADVSAHPRGLAGDLSTDAPNFDEARRALLNHGWHQTRPVDEPWHVSFGLEV